MTPKSVLIALPIILLAACGGQPETEEIVSDRLNEATEMDTANVDTIDGETEIVDVDMTPRTYPLINASGVSIGEITLTPMADAVNLKVNANAIPEGEHAIHFHETGSCVTPDFKSAGGHFNPMDTAHGFEAEGGPHPGDMRNFNAPRSGLISLDIDNERASLNGASGRPALIDADGSALIIHAGPDDYESQPSGAAGARIACAVID